MRWRRKRRSFSPSPPSVEKTDEDLQQDRLEWEYRSNLREWEKYAEKTDVDLVEGNNRMDCHRVLLEDNLQ